jgi:hypothetical protein
MVANDPACCVLRVSTHRVTGPVERVPVVLGDQTHGVVQAGDRAEGRGRLRRGAVDLDELGQPVRVAGVRVAGVRVDVESELNPRAP